MRASSGTGDLLDGLENAVDLLDGVIVAEADARRSPSCGQAKSLHDGHRVVVTIPDEDASFRERLGVVARMSVLQAERERRRALADAGWVGDAEQPRAARELAQEPVRERGLVLG